MAIENKDLRYKILASIAGTDAITRFNNELKKTSQNSQELKTDFERLKDGAKALAGMWVVKEVIQYGKHLIDTGNKIDDVSQKTGVAVKELSLLSGSAEANGLSLEILAGHLNKLNNSVIEAVTGTSDYSKIFKILDIQLKDSSGNLRGTSDIFEDVADRFSKMQDGATKAAIANKLFGKSGFELIPFLNKGAEGVTKFSLAIDSEFASRSTRFNDSLASMKNEGKNFALSGMNEIIPTLQEIADNFYFGSENSTIFKEEISAVGETARITVAAVNVLTVGIMNTADIVRTMFVKSAYLAKDAWEGTATSIYDTGRGIWKAATGDFKGAQDVFVQLAHKAKSGFQQAGEEQGRLSDEFIDRFIKRGEDAGKKFEQLMKNSALFGNGSNGARKDTDPNAGLVKGQINNINDLIDAKKNERDRVKEFIEQQQLENKQRKDALGDINLSTLEVIKITEARKLEADAIRYSKTMSAEQRAELMKNIDTLKAQRDEIVAQEYAMQRTWQYGAKKFLRDYIDEATNAAIQAEKVFKTSFNSLEDTFTNFVKTGKLNFKDFADSVITELIRIAVRQSVLVPMAKGIESFMGPSFADGGIMTSSGPLPLNKYANGGIANSPQLALFGEGRTPEAYVPLPDGRTIPVTMKGGSGGVSVSMNINIDNSGKETSESSSSREDGKALGNLIKRTVLTVITDQKRPGGILAGGR